MAKILFAWNYTPLNVRIRRLLSPLNQGCALNCRLFSIFFQKISVKFLKNLSLKFTNSRPSRECVHAPPNQLTTDVPDREEEYGQYLDWLARVRSMSCLNMLGWLTTTSQCCPYSRHAPLFQVKNRQEKRFRHHFHVTFAVFIIQLSTSQIETTVL